MYVNSRTWAQSRWVSRGGQVGGWGVQREAGEWFPEAAVTDPHTPSGLKQQVSILNILGARSPQSGRPQGRSVWRL